jgi:membrane fusion protein (multidrug efflux system)
VVLGVVVIGVAVAGWLLIPKLVTMFITVSTDDAYVNSHVTFVAPRVAGQVKEVLVDDNKPVKKGDILVLLDPVPYQVIVNVKKAAVRAAKADLVTAEAQVHGLVAQARSNRFKLEHAIEDVNSQIANLRAAAAVYESKKASLELARADYQRGKELAPKGISKEDLDKRRQTVKIDEAEVEQALQKIYSIRVGLGQDPVPKKGKDLTWVTPGLDQNFSTVRQALAELLQSAAPLGIYPPSYNATPRETIADFYKRDPKGDLDRIYAEIIPRAPAIQQAKARLAEAERDLDQAQLNLDYCTIVSEIDGVVTRRNVNPGNYVQVGQSLMAVRSLTEIWIDCNFKETQLGELRIGMPVKIEVDMYGRHQEFKGRITGFTMGTGASLSLLPPQNATGNFVKIVQRLPVKVELFDYKPGQYPLFVGLSCTPYVYVYDDLVGNDPGKGNFLQPFASLPQAPTDPKP